MRIYGQPTGHCRRPAADAPVSISRVQAYQGAPLMQAVAVAEAFSHSCSSVASRSLDGWALVEAVRR